MSEALLQVKDLTVTIQGQEPQRLLLDRVCFEVYPQEIVGLISPSGGGKTSLALSLLNLLPSPRKIIDGNISFQGKDILSLSADELCRLRGGVMSYVFQEPLMAFNPVLSIGEQIAEALQYHTTLNKKQVREQVLATIKDVGLLEAQRVFRSYPHQLSGGMRQRAMIAQAIVAHPKMIIADEPTSNLDVIRQAEILEVFGRLKAQKDISILLISHDLGLMKKWADRVLIMDQGRIVEQGSTQMIFNDPKQALTKELLMMAGA